MPCSYWHYWLRSCVAHRYSVQVLRRSTVVPSQVALTERAPRHAKPATLAPVRGAYQRVDRAVGSSRLATLTVRAGIYVDSSSTPIRMCVLVLCGRGRLTHRIYDRPVCIGSRRQ